MAISGVDLLPLMRLELCIASMMEQALFVCSATNEALPVNIDVRADGYMEVITRATVQFVPL